jgi:hypothetical protein
MVWMNDRHSVKAIVRMIVVASFSFWLGSLSHPAPKTLSHTELWRQAGVFGRIPYLT